MYRLFLYILLPHCVYYTSHVKERWILLKSLYGKCGQLIYLFPWRHVLFAGSSPYYCIICVISMCYTCQLYDICYLHISDILTFCIFFYLCYVYCLKQLFMYFMSVYWCIWTWQMIMEELFIDIHIFHHVVTFIQIFSFFYENCYLYCIHLHIIYCKITLIILMAHTFSTITYHMNFYHIQTTLCFNYYRCFRRVYHYLLHSLLLKLYM